MSIEDWYDKNGLVADGRVRTSDEEKAVPCDHIICAWLVDYDTGSLMRQSEIEAESWYKPEENKDTTLFNYCPECGVRLRK